MTDRDGLRLRDLPSLIHTAANQALEETTPVIRLRETGTVTHVGDGIARLRGLPGLRSEELVAFPGGLLGMTVDLDVREAGIVLLGDDSDLTPGSEARRTGRLVDTPVGEDLLGRVLDPTGHALDTGPGLHDARRRDVEQPAPAILDRAAVHRPLQTGIKSVDALVPVGRGQRELIVGDRQTGKTSIALNAIANQQGDDVVCVYCSIGQRGTAVARVIDTLRRRNALAHTVVVHAAGEDPPGLRYIAPYAAMAMAEDFMARGQDVLLVYDDLTRHARAYRELSLLLRRPPGREAFPGDTFYIHSRLLERATQLSTDNGGGSITALPVVETQAQNISAYIPTNLISITDGQIYVSPRLFRKGFMPAVDIGQSVSRVGGDAQLPAYRAVAGDLRLAYSQFEELETFSRFATRLDEKTRQTIERGRRVREILKQSEGTTLTVGEQIAALRAVTTGLLDEIPVDEITSVETVLQDAIDEQLEDTVTRLKNGERLSEEQWRELDQVLADSVQARHR